VVSLPRAGRGRGGAQNRIVQRRQAIDRSRPVECLGQRLGGKPIRDESEDVEMIEHRCADNGIDRRWMALASQRICTMIKQQAREGMAIHIPHRIELIRLPNQQELGNRGIAGLAGEVNWQSATVAMCQIDPRRRLIAQEQGDDVCVATRAGREQRRPALAIVGIGHAALRQQAAQRGRIATASDDNCGRRLAGRERVGRRWGERCRGDAGKSRGDCR
jgi:hypothetical protein